MCTGMELLLGGLSALGSVASVMMQPKIPDPPPLPASAPDPVRAPGATVRLGVDEMNPDQSTDTEYVPFEAKRVKTGKALGGLGRGGLGL